jgi:hypothetical protein
VPDGPADQPGVEPRQCAGVRRLDGGPPPHTLLPRLHLAPRYRLLGTQPCQDPKLADLAETDSSSFRNFTVQMASAVAVLPCRATTLAFARKTVAAAALIAVCDDLGGWTGG